jgi:glycosyltransferase involved in cell wall biosynthesis
VPDGDLPDLFARCKAAILPGVEDFAITPVQAQAAGRPVIACGAGGALDTVIEGETGVFFSETTPEALMETVREFDPDTIDSQACVRNAMRFDASVFKKQVCEFIDQVTERQGA